MSSSTGSSAAKPAYHHSDDPESYATNASFVYSDEFTRAVLQLLDPKEGEHVLDIGSGNGDLSNKVRTLLGQSGSLLGLDASAEMTQDAVLRWGHYGSNFDQCDCQRDLLSYLTTPGLDVQMPTMPLKSKAGTFDKVFSNAALHWMRDSPSGAIEGAFAALKPGGIFAAEMGGFMNMIGVRGALHTSLRRRGINAQKYDPWYFPTPAAYSALLEQAGFSVQSIELVPRPTKLPASGIEGWLQTFAGPFLMGLETDEEREEVVQEVEEFMQPDCYDPATKEWTVMYVRLRFKAVKPNSAS